MKYGKSKRPKSEDPDSPPNFGPKQAKMEKPAKR